jgi:1,2-diacylglycerol 3-beta-galactosyltransferase
MSDWLRCADLVVSKAGPSTIAGAAAVGVPLLLPSHLPGQEAGIADFAVAASAPRRVRGPRTASQCAKRASLLAHASQTAAADSRCAALPPRVRASRRGGQAPPRGLARPAAGQDPGGGAAVVL